jgi:hypothetical protein
VRRLVQLKRNNQVKVKDKDERQYNLSLCCWKKGITKVSLSYLSKS